MAMLRIRLRLTKGPGFRNLHYPVRGAYSVKADLTGSVMDAIHAFPSLRSRLRGGAFRIGGRFSRDETDHGVTDAKLAREGSMPAPSSPWVKLHVRGVSKAYDASTVLQPMELKVYSGELLALLGPSGSGKTTLLQIICGLTEPTGGRLLIDGRDETDNPANKRDVGVVFQNYALFPHLTVRENVSFPLQMRRTPAGALRDKVEATLAMVGLSGFGDRFPGELSGGQQQRVALARCFVYQPSLILMDESLSALDKKLRDSMRIEIKRLHRETGATNIFVADFIGASNVMHGSILAGGGVRTEDGVLPLPDRCAAPAGGQGALVVRPEKLVLCNHDEGFVSGRVEESIYAGSETRLLVRLASGTLMTVRRQAGLPPVAIGENVAISWDKEQARLL